VLHVEKLSTATVEPTVALIAGVHGDEDEGVLAIRRVLRMLEGKEISGSVRALAVANPLARAACARETPEDGKNLARVFPGDAMGSVTDKIARIVTDEVIAGSDLMIDLHSAGLRYEMPLFCGYCDTGDEAGERSAAAARTFGAPITWAHDGVNPGRTISAALSLGIPCIYAEAGGGGGVRGEHLDAFVEGILRVLGFLGVIPEREPSEGPRFFVEGGHGDMDHSISSPADGFLVTRASAGDVVSAGALLAEIYDTEGYLIEEVGVPQDGIIMQLRRRAKIAAGDPVAMLAPPPRRLDERE
jgi:predicted deacylase